jgi:N-acetylglucosaminyl-diphospho-decaprenol L-rhamnosyltransferase
MSEMTQPHPLNRLLIVIVNYRSAPLTINCLRTLESEIKALPGTHVTVVENDSRDDSLAKIAAAIQTENWQDWVTLIPSQHNGGYAYGNNLGIRPALQSENPPQYVLLLNPDTRVHSGALHALVDFMDANPQAGIAGSSFEDDDGNPWPYAFRFPSILSEVNDGIRLGLITKLLDNWVIPRTMEQDKPQQIDWLPGASMMIRREVLEQVGLMDEGYFLYFEETDFCLQAKRQGWECWYVPQSHVTHICGQSTGVTTLNTKPKRLPQYWFDSRRRYFLKNYGFLYTAIADAVWIGGFALWRLRRAIQNKPDWDPPHYLSDFIRNSVFSQGGAIPTSKLPSG